jgi:hypothetical protein
MFIDMEEEEGGGKAEVGAVWQVMKKETMWEFTNM